MIPLTEAESAHVTQFVNDRADWRMCVMSERVSDEMSNSPVHKYAKAHPYITGMQYVLHRIREMGACKLLDIGSPLVQSVALSCLPGVEVTVLDVRPNDDAGMLGLRWHLASATSLPYADASWDIVTSLWVMGHVGDGRYGDDLVVDGDLRMLNEIARVTRPGGTAIIGPGLVDETCGNIFNLHRIYSWPWLLDKFDKAGFDVLEQKDLFVSNEFYVSMNEGHIGVAKRDGHYGLALLKKR
jgi:SAM-dependent methyltransferase